MLEIKDLPSTMAASMRAGRQHAHPARADSHAHRRERRGEKQRHPLHLGLVKDTKGEVLFTPAARDGSEPRAEQLLGKSPRTSSAGHLGSPEGRRILPLTVENLMLGAYIRNDKERDRAGHRLGLQPVPAAQGTQLAEGGTLSGGEQQMLAVGRALLMSRPDLVMLDEPSLGLAPLLVRKSSTSS